MKGSHARHIVVVIAQITTVMCFPYQIGWGSAGATYLTSASSRAQSDWNAPPVFATPNVCFAEINSDNVTDYASADASAVQEAINAASEGSTIRLAGTCNGTTAYAGSSQIAYVTKTLTLRGGFTPTNWTISDPAAYPTILDAKGGGRVVLILSATGDVGDLIVQNGYSDVGGGLYAVDTLTLTSVAVLSNTATGNGGAFAYSRLVIDGGYFANNGGGGAVTWGTATVSGTHFISNSTGFSGGGLEVGSAVTITGGLFENNSASGGGGGVSSHGTLRLIDTAFISNVAGSGGGAGGDAVYVSGGVFRSNGAVSVNGNGGGLFANVLDLTGTHFLSNTALGTLGGGGVYAYGTARVTNAVFISNVASSSGGGGFKANNSLAISGTKFISNLATFGGGAYVVRQPTVHGGLFQGNRATVSGGGIYCEGLVSTDAWFVGNLAQYGGAVFDVGVVVLDQGVYQDNVATTGKAGGIFSFGGVIANGGVFERNGAQAGDAGGLHTYGTLVLTGTQFLSNTGKYSGGALANGPVTVTRALFQNNKAQLGSGGGLASLGTVSLLDSHFISNSAQSGGGLVALQSATVVGGSFQDNVALNAGGGAALYGGGYLTDTVFVNNLCSGCQSSGGGGAYAAASLSIVGVGFIGNNANGPGGGLSYQAGAITSTAMSVENSLFARNIARGYGGWSLALTTAGNARILHSTIASPTLASGSAILFGGAGALGITNTLVASHSIGIEANFGMVIENYNLFSGVLTPTVGTAVKGGSSFSGPAAFFNTTNYTLTARSVAVDSGTDVGIATDFFGSPRPQGGAPDIGYFESSFRHTYVPHVYR